MVAEGTVAIHETLRPATVVQAFAAKYGWDITLECDEDLGQLTLLEFRPHRWMLGLELPIIERDSSTEAFLNTASSSASQLGRAPDRGPNFSSSSRNILQSHQPSSPRPITRSAIVDDRLNSQLWTRACRCGRRGLVTRLRHQAGVGSSSHHRRRHVGSRQLRGRGLPRRRRAGESVASWVLASATTMPTSAGSVRRPALRSR